jgi:ABC-2 type transport system ATP-binding protein
VTSDLDGSQRRPTDDGVRPGAALVVEHLTKRFGDRVAYEDVSFEVACGEVFGFLGPNGAGKTTTVRTLGTLLAPSSGSATIAGIPLAPENGVEIRRRISIMPEAPGLYQRLTVAENLECFASLYEVPVPRERIELALRAVNLADRAGDPCGSLSKGLRQRVALARALLPDPQVLFLDEPTSGLDPVAAREVHELIDGLRQRGATIFLTTHRLEEAERLCDRVAILNTALRIIGRPGELRDRLFAKTLTVKTLLPLPDPGRVFSGLPAVDSWHQDGASYVIAISDPATATPAVTRAQPASAAGTLAHGQVLVYMLGIPALVPATFASISVAGERQQGTLEPVLTTPIRREEFLLGKALAALVPAISVSYGVFGVFVAAIELFAQPAVASAVLRGPELIAQVLFTPLVAALSIWIGIAISARSNDPRVAAQLSVLASLPSIVVTTLIATGKIHVTPGSR